MKDLGINKVNASKEKLSKVGHGLSWQLRKHYFADQVQHFLDAEYFFGKSVIQKSRRAQFDLRYRTIKNICRKR